MSQLDLIYMLYLDSQDTLNYCKTSKDIWKLSHSVPLWRIKAKEQYGFDLRHLIGQETDLFKYKVLEQIANKSISHGYVSFEPYENSQMLREFSLKQLARPEQVDNAIAWFREFVNVAKDTEYSSAMEYSYHMIEYVLIASFDTIEYISEQASQNRYIVPKLWKDMVTYGPTKVLNKNRVPLDTEITRKLSLFPRIRTVSHFKLLLGNDIALLEPYVDGLSEYIDWWSSIPIYKHE